MTQGRRSVCVLWRSTCAAMLGSFVMLLSLSSQSSAQELYRRNSFGCNTTDASFIAGKKYQSGYTATIYVNQWRELVRDDFRKQVADAVLKDMTSVCMAKGERANLVAILMMSTRYTTNTGQIITLEGTVLKAWMSADERQWHFTQDFVAQAIAKEDQGIEQAAELKRREEAQQRAQIAQAEAKEKQKQAALADCGPSPQVTGGPWFSSTYSIAALDAARHGNYLCTKTIEYISAAPNPFGGKAARARFTGYRAFDFQLVNEVRDFAY